MGDSGGEGGEAQAIVHSKERAKVELAIVIVARDVKVESSVVEDARDVIFCASVVESVGRDERKPLRVIDVVPIHKRLNNIAKENKANKDVDNGEEGRGERASKEGRDGTPIEAKGEKT